MAVLGVGSGSIFQEPSQKKANTAKGEGGAFDDILKASGSAGSSPSTQEMMEEIRNKKAEIYNKVRKGETAQSFQIGASSFTLKEWERFIKKFDKGQEELLEMIREAKENFRKEMAAKCGGNEEEETEAEAEAGKVLGK